MKCVICGKEINGWGNNAHPLSEGTCCDECNGHVVAARVLLAGYEKQPKEIANLASGLSGEPTIGAKLLIIEMRGEPSYKGKVGIIEHIDDLGQIHGTWGGCAVISNKDVYYIYGGTTNNG